MDIQKIRDTIISKRVPSIKIINFLGNGNDSDKAKFAQLISNFKKPVCLDSIFVADSALYTAENLLAIKNFKWITRVPLSIKAAQLYEKAQALVKSL